MTETRRTHVVGIDPGIRKCGIVMLEINAEPGFYPRPNQVAIAEPAATTTALIRPPTSKDLATRLGYLYGILLEYLDAGRRSSCTAFLSTEEDGCRDDGTPNGSTVAIVVEDPRDFPGAAKRHGDPRPGDKRTSVRTSVATHVTIGAAFGVCLAAAHARAIAWPTCPVVTVPSQEWWPRGGGRKLKHDAALERIRLSWPAIASLPEDCVAAAGVAMYWYCNNLPPR